jgi:hypothetical protein
MQRTTKARDSSLPVSIPQQERHWICGICIRSIWYEDGCDRAGSSKRASLNLFPAAVDSGNQTDVDPQSPSREIRVIGSTASGRLREDDILGNIQSWFNCPQENQTDHKSKTTDDDIAMLSPIWSQNRTSHRTALQNFGKKPRHKKNQHRFAPICSKEDV